MLGLHTNVNSEFRKLCAQIEELQAAVAALGNRCDKMASKLEAASVLSEVAGMRSSDAVATANSAMQSAREAIGWVATLRATTAMTDAALSVLAPRVDAALMLEAGRGAGEIVGAAVFAIDDVSTIYRTDLSAAVYLTSPGCLVYITGGVALRPGNAVSCAGAKRWACVGQLQTEVVGWAEAGASQLTTIVGSMCGETDSDTRVLTAAGQSVDRGFRMSSDKTEATVWLTFSSDTGTSTVRLTTGTRVSIAFFG